MPDRDELLRLVQRYKFESNSQRHSEADGVAAGCCDQYKDTNLKAIHNVATIVLVAVKVVAISTKIQI